MIAPSASKIIMCWAVLLLTRELAQAQTESDENSSPEQPSAAEIVRKIIADEGKIEEVKSIYLRFEGKWTNTEAEIAERTARLFPGLAITSEKFPELLPEMTEELEIAWDERRIRKLRHWHKHQYTLQVWDGESAIIHELALATGREHYAFDRSPHKYISDSLFNDLSWQRLGPPPLWFFPPMALEKVNARYGRPEDYVLAGEKMYRDRRCHVLEIATARLRLYVGIEDLRLYGIEILYLPKTVFSGENGIANYNEVSGTQFSDLQEADRWVNGLSESQRQEVVQRTHLAAFKFTRPMCEFYLDDYREIATGLWFPAKQGNISYDTQNDQQVMSFRRDLRLVKVTVNEPLDDSLFKIELKDGVKVYDWGHDPPLRYEYKANRTLEEWQVIVDEAKQDDEQMNQAKAARDALISLSAPNFPETHWLNSDPLTWDKLRGKVVILDFWAIWCEPCRADIPGLKSLHKASQESGIVVIGVHNPGSELTGIEKHLNEFEIEHPIVIDTPASKGSGSWGAISSWFGVDQLPYAFVIDQQGKVAGHGTLAEMSVLARQLTKKKQ